MLMQLLTPLSEESEKASLLRLLTLTVMLVLIVCIIASIGFKALTLLVIAPLAIFLPYLGKGKVRSYQWLAFMILLYFIQSTLAVFANTGLMLPVIQLMATVLIFVSSILYVHTRYKSTATEPDSP